MGQRRTGARWRWTSPTCWSGRRARTTKRGLRLALRCFALCVVTRRHASKPTSVRSPSNSSGELGTGLEWPEAEQAGPDQALTDVAYRGNVLLYSLDERVLERTEALWKPWCLALTAKLSHDHVGIPPS